MTSWQAASARLNEEQFRLFVEAVRDHAIILLDPDGVIVGWNTGASLLTGYQADEAIGQSETIFSPIDAGDQRATTGELRGKAAEQGSATTSGWWSRKDGSRFWADVTITAARDDTGRLLGFSKVMRDLTERRQAEEDIRALNRQLTQQAMELETVNQELEAFSYSVSHDLRAPLRAMDGFSLALLEDYGDQFDDVGRDYLHRIRAATQRMGQLIDDLLGLSRVTRREMRREPVDLSRLAEEIVAELRQAEPERRVEAMIAPDLQVNGDPWLLRVALANLLGNAWKFTGKRAEARVEVGMTQQAGRQVFFVRDNGAGFDMTYASKLFSAFQRLHTTAEFPGTGIGLATAKRVINRHGGHLWAEGAVDQGATFFFTL